MTRPASHRKCSGWRGDSAVPPLPGASRKRSSVHRVRIAYDLVWFDRDGKSPQPASVWPLDAIFRGVDVACFRSSWDDPNALYLAVKGGDNKAPHAHLDLGQLCDGCRRRAMGRRSRSRRLRSSRLLRETTLDVLQNAHGSPQHPPDRRPESGPACRSSHHPLGLWRPISAGSRSIFRAPTPAK